MSLEQQLDRLIAQRRGNEAVHSTDALIRCLDLTLLDKQTSSTQLLQLKTNAINHPVAAVCVFSEHLKDISSLNHGRLATVINFPTGRQDINECITEIDRAKKQGAQEIDYVLPYTQYLSGEQKSALSHAEQVIQYCKANRLTVKVIIESGAFSTMQQIYEVSQSLIALNCDFIKTSTGTIQQGASLSAAFAILSAIKDTQSSCGIKLSGGVKTIEQALSYQYVAECMMEKAISPDWFRIGASSLLEALDGMNKILA